MLCYEREISHSTRALLSQCVPVLSLSVTLGSAAADRFHYLLSSPVSCNLGAYNPHNAATLKCFHYYTDVADNEFSNLFLLVKRRKKADEEGGTRTSFKINVSFT